MTADEYRDCLRAMGLTPAKPSYDGATLHQDAAGQFTSIPNPEQLSPEERLSMIDLIRTRLGITNH
ncbi:MAG: hypothetical protein VW338_00940 [Rhodospirillaceae bacterium]